MYHHHCHYRCTSRSRAAAFDTREIPAPRLQTTATATKMLTRRLAEASRPLSSSTTDRSARTRTEWYFPSKKKFTATLLATRTSLMHSWCLLCAVCSRRRDACQSRPLFLVTCVPCHEGYPLVDGSGGEWAWSDFQSMHTYLHSCIHHQFRVGYCFNCVHVKVCVIADAVGLIGRQWCSVDIPVIKLFKFDVAVIIESKDSCARSVLSWVCRVSQRRPT